jgi:excisionase family DNA binding protein
MSHESAGDDKTRLISLPEAAELYGFSHSYLKQLAQKRRLKAQKLGGIWLTTPEDVESYILSRQKRGAFRDDISID